LLHSEPSCPSNIALATLRGSDLGDPFQGGVMMTKPDGVEVTLSSDLLRHLRAEARKLGIAIEWLIASMVVDTAERLGKGSDGPIAV
jgi:hypothetical protein